MLGEAVAPINESGRRKDPRTQVRPFSAIISSVPLGTALVRNTKFKIIYLILKLFLFFN
jgi:hypothetical protein